MKNASTETTAYPLWHRTGSGYWHYYLDNRRSVCGDWHLLDHLNVPADATKRMPSRAHGGGKVCKTCEANRP